MHQTWEQAEEKATATRDTGDNLFHEGDYEGALQTLKEGICIWKKFLENFGHDFDKSENNLLSSFYCSIGKCHEKLHEAGDEIHTEEDGTSINRLQAGFTSHSLAIQADPIWRTPYLERSNICDRIKDVYTKEEGVLNTTEANEDRNNSDIIIDISQRRSRKVNKQMIVNDLSTAISMAKEGNQIFVEKGVYEFENNLLINKKVTLVGVSTAAIIRSSQTQGEKVYNITIQAPLHHVTFRRLRIQTPMAVQACKKFTIEQCLFDGEHHLALIQMTPKIIPKDLRKKYNLVNEFKNMLEISMKLSWCVFYKCNYDKLFHSISCEGEKGEMEIENSLFYKCHTVEVSHGGTLSYKNCEIQGGSLESTTSILSTKAVLNLYGCNFTQDRNSLCFAAKSTGLITKTLFQNEPSVSYPKSLKLIHIFFDETNVAVERNLFLKELASEHHQTGIFIKRKYSTGCKIRKNEFIQVTNGVMMINGACPNILENHFLGKVQKHITAVGGATPNILENLFDEDEDSEMCIVFTQGSGGLCGKNKFSNPSKCIVIDETSRPFLMDNIFYKKSDTFFITDKPIKYMVNCTEMEKKAAENLKKIREETPQKAMRICNFCKECAPCSLCANCKDDYYCSPQCQEKDWPSHSENCSRIETVKKFAPHKRRARKERLKSK